MIRTELSRRLRIVYPSSEPSPSMSSPSQFAYFGGGCFWCTEAVYEQIRGVVSVMPGYAGGQTTKPSYEQICTGETGHAEVIRIEFDPSIISFEDLLSVFFAAHDPTTLNRQGNDVGTQYRSIILYTSPEQKAQAEVFIKKIDDDDKRRVVTEVVPLDIFYEAEAYHHHYFQSHPDQAYCQLIINPKLEKVKAKFQQLLKT